MRHYHHASDVAPLRSIAVAPSRFSVKEPLAIVERSFRFLHEQMLLGRIIRAAAGKRPMKVKSLRINRVLPFKICMPPKLLLPDPLLFTCHKCQSRPTHDTHTYVLCHGRAAVFLIKNLGNLLMITSRSIMCQVVSKHVKVLVIIFCPFIMLKV